MHCSPHTLIVTKPTSPQIHNGSFSPIQACVQLSTRYRASEKWNQSALIRHVWLEIFIYLFIHFARLLVLRVFARTGACSSCSYSPRSCRLSDEHSALHCSIIPSTANHHKALSSCWLAAIPPCWGFCSLPFFFFFPTELPHSLRTVYVGGIVK